MQPLEQLVARIVEEQELVIGPLAWSEAQKVPGLNVENRNVSISAPDGKVVVDTLVAQYERLFGRASHEVCREAAAPFLATLPQAEVPTSLR